MASEMDKPLCNGEKELEVEQKHESPISKREVKVNTEYFTSYGDIGVHELMLKDRPRTLAYKKFIEKNQHLFKDKVVLDVGAGSGILSLFAASAGAKQVYAVEASGMAEVCRKIVQCNDMQHTISVLHGKVEEIHLPVEEVDVILSEWMGFYLLHESMLDSVIYARDKWLAKSGLMVPSHATLYLTPINMTDYVREHFLFWDDVYGYNFEPLKSMTMSNALQQPLITTVCEDSNKNIAEPRVVTELELKTISLDAIQNVKKTLSFEILQTETIHGFVSWFDIDFTAPPTTAAESVTHVTLSTSPSAPQTHWKQTVFFMPSALCVETGETIHCKMELSQDEGNKRHYNISIEMTEKEDNGDETLTSEDSESDFDEDENEDESGHPVPCDCGSGRCKLISAIMSQYESEHAALENEAEFVDVAAEVDAARTVEAMDNTSDFETDSSP